MPSRSSDRLAQVLVEPEAALFVYGSLRFPDVLRVLLDRVPNSFPAAVDGWRVAALRDRVYPALVPAEKSANGLVINGLTPDEWNTLDAFEDNLYTLRRLATKDGNYAWAYVTEDDNPTVLTNNWDPDAFRRDDLTAYLERCRNWRQRYEQTATP
jgi:gamma-glutamylcyclotransferase (GGCT)/AIG2-like uncharacterized protein YtfP